MENVVVIDLETTGLNRHVDDILQVAIIDGHSNTILNEYVKPSRRKNWPKAQEKNGISFEMVKDCKGILDHADAIENAINNADIVVGYNLDDFDLPFLFSAGIEVKPKKTFDVMKAFAPIYGDYSEKHGSFAYKSLSICARHYQYGEWEAHLGVHRFFVGKYGTAVLMLLTAGGAGIWWIIDIVTVATGNFTDMQGKFVKYQG